MIDCNTPPDVTNADIRLNTGGFTMVNSTAEYTCHTGFQFPTGNVTAETVCLESGVWDPVPDCEGK